jgi:hypothetical protein
MSRQIVLLYDRKLVVIQKFGACVRVTTELTIRKCFSYLSKLRVHISSRMDVARSAGTESSWNVLQGRPRGSFGLSDKFDRSERGLLGNYCI